MSIEAKVKKITAEQLGIKEEDVGRSASFIDDLGADSLDAVELILAFEEEFRMKIPDEDAEKVATVSGAIGYISEKMAVPVQNIGTKGDTKAAMEGTR